jgi:hypothetical protein
MTGAAPTQIGRSSLREGQEILAPSSPTEVLAWLKAHPTLRPQPLLPRARLPTGLAALDELLDGGLPCGAITELVGKGSSGRTSLTLAVLANATQRGEVVAWIDPQDALDPVSAKAAGVDLQRLLWVRPTGLEAVKIGLGATDLVLDAGGFAVLALDLAGSRWRSVLGRPAVWLRLKHRLERSRTVLLVLAREEATGSMAALRFECRRQADGDELLVRVVRQLHGAPGAEARLRLGEAVD